MYSPQPDPILVQLFTEALAHQSQGNLNMALVVYKRTQRQFPDFIDAWINASVVLLAMDRAEEALDMAVRAVELSHENVTALCALANAQHGLGKMDEALEYFQKALSIDPNHIPVLTKMVGIHNLRGQFAKALSIGDRAILAQPDNSMPWVNRGYTKFCAMDLAGAEYDFARALELDKNNALAHYNMGALQLLQNRYHDAWPHLLFAKAHFDWEEWEKRTEKTPDFGKPQWHGEPLNGRTLLIYCEQGFGDRIQFARFISHLRQFGGHILFLTSPPLDRLMSSLLGIDSIVLKGEPLPEFDLVVPLMEVPAIIDIDYPDVAPLPYPSLPEPQAISELNRPGFKVCLTWAGSKTHGNNALRSMNPHYFDALADMEGIAWYGLQLPRATELPNLPGILDLSHYMNDFFDTAQLIRQMDLVVTVDTSMLHVAGSLGLPAVVLLAFKPDWRWGAAGRQTPWYPSLTLLRQPAYGDWKSVISDLRILITERVDSGNQ